jgi:glycosyltransferase involved in cell wall biosynthesis
LNVGQGTARNLAIKFADGAFIGPLDADDAYEKDGLGMLLRELEARPEVDVVHGHATCYDKDLKRPVGDAGWFERDIDERNLAQCCCSVPSLQLIRKDVFVERGFWYSEYMSYCEDYEWLVRAWRGQVLFHRVRESVVRKRWHFGEDSHGRPILDHHREFGEMIRECYGLATDQRIGPVGR